MPNTKSLIVCADGTWDAEDGTGTPTNVARLHHAIQTRYVEGVNQLVYYHSGVGTRWGERLTGGAFGCGINRNIIACYRFLVENYEAGDEIYLFGFSRGAYTVRSLAGLIRNSGIVKDPAQIREAFRLYRSRHSHDHPCGKRAKDFRRQNAKSAPKLAHAGNTDDYVNSPEITLIGVWDTVGSLGYPLPFFGVLKHVLPLFGVNWWFHDTALSTTVRYAYHAIAIHERRSDFSPTLWNLQTERGQPRRTDQHLEQVYFTGVHGDVGGGYGGAGLSDVTFRWMVQKAQDSGLLVRSHSLAPGPALAPEPLGRLHNSFTGLFLLLDVIRFRLHGRPRTFKSGPEFRTKIADSATERLIRRPTTPWPANGGADSFIRRVTESVDAPGLRASVLECLRA